MDKMMMKEKREEGSGKIEERCRHMSGSLRSPIFLLLSSCWILCLAFSGCATMPKKPAASETQAEQVDAAQKVVGAMAGREMTAGEMKQVASDIRKDESSRSAVQKILGTTSAPVIKYSPVTGKHYSGDLEFDPETGAKLEVIKE
jgi:hypothetical protein